MEEEEETWRLMVAWGVAKLVGEGRGGVIPRGLGFGFQISGLRYRGEGRGGVIPRGIPALCLAALRRALACE